MSGLKNNVFIVNYAIAIKIKTFCGFLDFMAREAENSLMHKPYYDNFSAKQPVNTYNSHAYKNAHAKSNKKPVPLSELERGKIL